MSEEQARAPIDAATVVVARNASDGIEVLMLKRTSKVHFGGMWVFPGGRVDAGDYDGAADQGEAFKNAAVREAKEECDIDRVELVHISHWLPPAIRAVRYSTNFFLAEAPQDMAQISPDGHEIAEHEWMSPDGALKRRHAGEIEIVTPTFVTLDWLRRHSTVADAKADVDGPVEFHTHILQTESGNIAFYKGDVAYDSLDLAAPGPRRRCNMLDTGWWWEEHDGWGNGPWACPVDFGL